MMDAGLPKHGEELLPVVYDELRKLAARQLGREKPGQTLSATALVHEAYLRLAGSNQTPKWQGKGHFYVAAAEAMRRILVDRARRRMTEKHGGGRLRVEFDYVDAVQEEPPAEVLAVHEALDQLELHDATTAQLVKLRYFAGLSHQEAAEALGMTRRAADRVWALARAWLFEQIHESP